MSNGADQNIDLFQESIRQGFGIISEKLEALVELMAEAPSAGHILALTQAVQYQGLLDFHRIMLEFGGAAVEMANERKTVLDVERAKQILIASGLSKVMPPPFEAAMKAALVASRIKMTSDHVDDALKAEAAQEAALPPDTLKGFMSEESWELLKVLRERTGKKPWLVIQEALAVAVVEASEEAEKAQQKEAERAQEAEAKSHGPE